MQIIQSRRDFLAGLSSAGAAGFLRARRSLASEDPPEVTAVRLVKLRGICLAPQYVAEELLRAEGFTEIGYVEMQPGLAAMEKVAGGEADFTLMYTATLVRAMDAGLPLTVVAGVHPGCFELFAHEPIQTVSDLKGKKVGIQACGSSRRISWSRSWRRTSGSILTTTSTGSRTHRSKPMQLFAEGKIDAFLGFPPEPQELRARKIGHVIVNSAIGPPLVAVLLLHAGRQPGFRAAISDRDQAGAARHPQSHRHLRRRARAHGAAAGRAGSRTHYDYALQTLNDVPYASGANYDPEDTMRFYALRLHEVGMIKSSPNKIIAEGTDWRFLNELKRELKA